jgi:hypothetical protein
MSRKSPYPDAEGIADASGDEKGEQQRATSRQKDRPKAVSVVVKFAQQPRSAVRPFGALRLLCGRRFTLHLLLSILGRGCDVTGCAVHRTGRRMLISACSACARSLAGISRRRSGSCVAQIRGFAVSIAGTGLCRADA